MAETQTQEGQNPVQTRAEGDGQNNVQLEDLLKAGTHFGHLTSRWHPKMKPYIFMERNNIHIIDLMQTQAMLDKAVDAAYRFGRRGTDVLFVGTKKQAQQIVREAAESCESPFVVDRWLGGMLTNFQTMRRSIRRMEDLYRMEEEGTLDMLKKKERLVKLRERDKLETTLGGIAKMPRLPGALFIVDIRREHIAVAEAKKLGIPIIAMVDTNCDPNKVDFPIPSNDDALKSIKLITEAIANAVREGQASKQAEDQAKAQAKKEEAQRQKAQQQKQKQQKQQQEEEASEEDAE